MQPESRGVPSLDRSGLHQMGAALPAFQTFRQRHPENSKGSRELRAWIFLCLDAVLADSQLTFDREKPRRQDGFGLHQCQEEAEGISEELASELKDLMRVP